MKRLVTYLWLATLAFTSVHVQAIPLTWTLTDVTFDTGGTATGSFVYDADTNALSNWNIFTTAGDGPFHLTDKNYTTSNASQFLAPVSPGPFGMAWYTILESSEFGHPFNSALKATIRIGTTSLLTNAGGVVGLDLMNQSGECYSCSRFRAFNAGTLVARTFDVPEPTILSLMVIALAGIGFARRRKA